MHFQLLHYLHFDLVLTGLFLCLVLHLLDLLNLLIGWDLILVFSLYFAVAIVGQHFEVFFGEFLLFRGFELEFVAFVQIAQQFSVFRDGSEFGFQFVFVGLLLVEFQMIRSLMLCSRFTDFSVSLSIRSVSLKFESVLALGLVVYRLDRDFFLLSDIILIFTL